METSLLVRQAVALSVSLATAPLSAHQSGCAHGRGFFLSEPPPARAAMNGGYLLLRAGSSTDGEIASLTYEMVARNVTNDDMWVTLPGCRPIRLHATRDSTQRPIYPNSQETACPQPRRSLRIAPRDSVMLRRDLRLEVLRTVLSPGRYEVRLQIPHRRSFGASDSARSQADLWAGVVIWCA